MNTKKFLLIVAFAVVGMALMSCGLFSAIFNAKRVVEEAKHIAPTAEALATQQGSANGQGQQVIPSPLPTQAEQEAEPNPDSWHIPALGKDYHAFRTHMLFYISYPKENKKEVLLDEQEDNVLDKDGTSKKHIILKQPKDNTYIEIVQIGAQSWVSSDGKTWISQNANLGGVPFKPEDLFVQLAAGMVSPSSRWKLTGAESVAGIKAKHYTISGSAFPGLVAAFAAGGLGVDPNTLMATSIKGDLFVDSHNALLKGEFHIKGVQKAENGKDPFEVVFQYNVDHINDSSLKVELPKPAASASSAPFPLPPKATFVVSNSEGQLFYSVPGASVADVLKYLEDNLPKAGFKITNKQGSNDSGWTFNVVGKGKSYYVALMPGQDGVQIFIQK